MSENKVEEKVKKVHHKEKIDKEIFDKEIAELKTKIGELENKMLYKDAELINYRKRKDDEVSKFLSGFKMIYTRLLKILDDYEVKEIDALGKEFNPMYHQAVFSVEEKDTAPNIVLEVLQKGYMYKDKVIRPCMVKVSK